VLVGRAWAWAVAARGEAGVRHVLRVMKADIDVALGLTGYTSVADVDRSALFPGTDQGTNSPWSSNSVASAAPALPLEPPS
jgi:L-lactate dehydrogenase (cytochrome)